MIDTVTGVLPVEASDRGDLGDAGLIRGALKASEARFRAISEASPLGIFVSDAQGRCTYTNAAYQEISGLSFEETLGSQWSRAIHPDDRPRVLLEWGEAIRGLEPFQTEFRFLQRDESVVWTRVHSAVMSDGQAPHGRVKTVEDISERRRFEQAQHPGDNLGPAFGLLDGAHLCGTDDNGSHGSRVSFVVVAQHVRNVVSGCFSDLEKTLWPTSPSVWICLLYTSPSPRD